MSDIEHSSYPTDKDTATSAGNNVGDEISVSSGNGDAPGAENTPCNDIKPPCWHLIKIRWLRRTLKVLGYILLVLLILPWLVYIPPVQTFLKNVACNIAAQKTGMKISIDRFRLRFPLDISLDGIVVIEAKGDTMVRAGEAQVDVSLLPLLKLDVQTKKLRLLDGYYRMVSEDSSMITKVYAADLTAGPGTGANIPTGDIALDRVTLKGGRLDLYMNVWKQKPTPPQPGTFRITANTLLLENFAFNMSMLPTIDTLSVQSRRVEVHGGVIDLRKNYIEVNSAALDCGRAVYITPTAEYVKNHPAPPPSPYPSVPIVIKVRDMELGNFNALYATKGAKPKSGFDPAYMQFTDLNLKLQNFYNEASVLRLPIVSLNGRERCGLNITAANGTIAVDSTGIELQHLLVKTPVTDLVADATLSMAMMAMSPDGTFKAKASGHIGMSDIEAFMPALKTYTRMPGIKGPLMANVDIFGSLKKLSIPKFEIALPGLITLSADGHVENVMTPDKLSGALTFNGKLINPAPLQRMADLRDVNIPPLAISGDASAHGKDYAANFTLTSPAGDIRAKGNVGLNSERYYADVDVRGLETQRFMPTLGLGDITAHLHAKGVGFNPTHHGASTQVDLAVDHLRYNGAILSNITACASLHNGEYTLNLESNNDVLDGVIDASGTLAPDNYYVDLQADIAHLDLHALGLMTDTCSGQMAMTLQGNINPQSLLCNMKLRTYDLDWYMPGNHLVIPGSLEARLLSAADLVQANIIADQLNLNFIAPESLKSIIPKFQRGFDEIYRQVVVTRSLAVDEFQPMLPKFDMSLAASGHGILKPLLNMAGMHVDSLYADIHNAESIAGNAGVLALNTGTMTLDTVTLGLNERGKLLDYKLHLGNRPGTLDEFASVDLNGYVGQQRLSAYFRQKNIQGQTGYRLGFTAAFADSTVNLHFTPLNATIAYLPWEFNDDNYLSYNFKERIEANLQAKSKESLISLHTEQVEGKINPQLFVNLENIHIQDFMSMVIGAPPATGTLSTQMQLGYEGKSLTGNGSLDLKDFSYNGQRVADFKTDFDAGLDFNGDTQAHLTMDVNGTKALTLHATLHPGSTEITPGDVGVEVTEFPLSVANAFLGADVASLTGSLSGKMDMTGTFDAPLLNGTLSCNQVGVYLPIIGGRLRLDSIPLNVKDNSVVLEDFNIWGANSNPISLNGSVDAAKLNDIKLDLTLAGNNFMLINNNASAHSDIYGKILLNADASVKGSLNLMDINARLSILSGTNVFYTLSTTEQLTQTDTEDVVRFVQFSDTAAVINADSVQMSSNMRINANLNISNGVTATVNLSSNGSDKVQLTPYGQLYFFQNYMGDMRLNGQLNLGSGFARYSIPAIGEKRFDLQPDSYVLWNGDLMNPTLHISAYDKMKSVAASGSNGNTRLVEFLVSLQATGTLSHPNVLFDLSTDDDITIQNELQSMSADQRSNEAMNMILYGRYTGPGSASGNGNMLNNALYGFLESQLNNWAANNIRGVDLTFGIDQYQTSQDGKEGTNTSYSYQVSKSLFNNKFKIVVGGNYSTDRSNTDESIAEALVNNISFEYMLRQTNNVSMYVKLFRHSNYESILEGEITEMGVGYVMQRKLNNLRQLFSWLRKHRRKTAQGEKKEEKESPIQAVDTIAPTPAVSPNATQPDGK